MANEAPDPEPVVEAPPRLVDRIDSRIVNVLTAVGFGAPILVFFGMISVYSTNVILEDQLTDVPIIRASYVHLFPWGVLWQPYNEDRSFFPNLVVVLLAHLDHFDVTTEEYLGGVLLVAALVVLVRAHKRRSPEVPWLYYCPVFILVLSIVQYDTMLLGGVSWYLVALALAVAVSLLDRLALTWPVFVGALAAAVVGSFSAFAGLLIWPVGLFLLLVRRRPTRWSVAWVAVGLVTAAVYFHGLHDTGNSGAIRATPWTIPPPPCNSSSSPSVTRWASSPGSPGPTPTSCSSAPRCSPCRCTRSSPGCGAGRSPEGPPSACP